MSELRDPVAVLPIELVLCVFSHLALSDVWRLQSVSRRWHDCLASDVVENEALARFESHCASDTGRTELEDTPRSRRSRLRHLQAVQSHRPFASRKLYDTITIPHQMSWLNPCSLKGKYISYQRVNSPHNKTFVIHDLVLNRSFTLCSAARESICANTLSQDVAAFLPYAGLLHVAKLEQRDERMTTVRVQSSNTVALASSGHNVVVLQRENWTGDYSIVIHDARASKTSSFPLTAQSGEVRNDEKLHPQALLADSSRRLIDLFCCVRRQRRDHAPYAMEIGHMRFDFDGNKLGESILRSDCDFSSFKFRESGQDCHTDCKLGPVESIGVRDVHRVHFACRVYLHDEEYYKKWALMFDARRSRMYWSTLVDAYSSLNLERIPQTEVAVWKDRVYAPTDSGTIASSFLPSDVTSKPGSRQDYDTWVAAVPRGFLTAVNDSFAVCFDTKGGVIQIDYFDEELISPEAERSEYWKRRDNWKSRDNCEREVS